MSGNNFCRPSAESGLSGAGSVPLRSGSEVISQRVWHGDSRKLVPTLPDDIACIITDPPFGAAHWSRMATTPIGQQFNRPVEGDSNPEEAIKLFREVMTPLLHKAGPECDAYIFTRWDVLDIWQQACNFMLGLEQFKYKMLLVWDKGGPGLGDLDGSWGCGHELILYYKKGRRDVPYRQSAVIHIDKIVPGKICHPMEKPVALMERLIKMSTRPGELVVDPFSGSGATCVAAQRLGRSAIGIELDEQYVKTSRGRLEQMVMDFT